MAETRGLNDLDSRIAALEKALAQGPSEASDSSEESDSDKAPPSPITPKPKARKRQRPSENLILSESFAPIAPLHETLLPANGITSKIASQPHSSGNSSSSDAPFPERRCDVCPINTLFTTKDAWMRHRRDLLHRQNVVLAAGAVYEPSSGQALYCRVCKVMIQIFGSIFLQNKKNSTGISLLNCQYWDKK